MNKISTSPAKILIFLISSLSPSHCLFNEKIHWNLKQSGVQNIAQVIKIGRAILTIKRMTICVSLKRSLKMPIKSGSLVLIGVKEAKEP